AAEGVAGPVCGGRRRGRRLDGVGIRGRLLRPPDGGGERDGENQAKGHGPTRRFLTYTRHAPWATSSARIRLSSYRWSTRNRLSDVLQLRAARKRSHP